MPTLFAVSSCHISNKKRYPDHNDLNSYYLSLIINFYLDHFYFLRFSNAHHCYHDNKTEQCISILNVSVSQPSWLRDTDIQDGDALFCFMIIIN